MPLATRHLNRDTCLIHPNNKGIVTVNILKHFEDQVMQWPGISIHPHRFGGREFRFGAAELGHVHESGIVDVPFPRPLRDALLDEGLAEKHFWLPNSGWTTFRARSEKDLEHALWLMRLSYLRYGLKTTADPRKLLKKQSAALSLNPRFQTLLEQFLPHKQGGLKHIAI